MNRYLERRRQRMMRDGRNPYGSKGGYVVSSPRRMRGSMDYTGDYAGDYNYDYGMDYAGRGRHGGRRAGRRNSDYAMDQYPRFYGYGEVMYPPYEEGYDSTTGQYRRRERMMEDFGGSDEEYREELKEWTKKLKKYDKYGMSKEQVIQQARNHGAKFKEYDEEEFYATYLMMISDYKELSNDPTVFIKMAKLFLEDEDAEVKGSEKLCAYLYEIVLGEE